MPSLAHNIPRPAFSRVGQLSPLLFSVPDRNALWTRAEDGLLVQAVVKHSTSDVLGRDWSEVASELPGRSELQGKERYRLADTVVELTFVFLRVTFRGSPFLRSSHVLTNDAESADSARPIHYRTSDRRVARAPAFSPRSSLTHARRCISPRNVTSPMAKPAKLMYLSVSDSACEPAPSPSPLSSLTQAHRCIGPRNATSPVVNPARLMYLNVSDSDCEPAPSPSPPFLLTHARRCIGPRNATSPMAQPARLMYPSVSNGAYEPAPSLSPRFSLTHARRCIGPRNATSPMATPARLMYLSVFDSST
jgi:hypothetical protein